MSCNNIPPYNGTIEDPTVWASNFHLAGTGFISSKIPVTNMIKLPIKIAFIWTEWTPNNIYPSKKPAYIPRPPNLGIGTLCTFLAFGISIAPINSAIFFTTGINSATKTNVTNTINNTFFISIINTTPQITNTFILYNIFCFLSIIWYY